MRDVKEVNGQLASIVILTWNRKEDVRATLEKLRRVDYSPLEIIVVDNDSTDGTDSMILREFPKVKYLQQPKNLGIAGYNVGFKAAKGSYVVALDSDSYPAKNAITKMAKIFAENPRAGAVAFEVHSADADGGKAELSAGITGEVFGYHGAGVGFRKEVFRIAGYWYEPFFLYFNEMDHALGILSAGYKIIHSTDIVAFHKSSPAARASSDTAAYYYARNALWLIWRRYPLRRMFGATIHFIYLAVSESVHQRTTVYLRALRDGFKMSAQVLAGREPLGEALFKKVRLPLQLVFTRWA